jgi:lambda repressor-like predicted transcriptional regulator
MAEHRSGLLSKKRLIMHPADIQARLKKRGLTQKQVAEKIGVCEMVVSKVINGLIVSDRVMRAVSAEIGMDHRQVFAWYYLKPAKRSTSKVANV